MKKQLSFIFLAAATLPALAQDSDPLPDPTPVVLAPDDRSFIKTYMGRYQNGMVNLQKDKVILMRYFEQQLKKNQLPIELKNLVVVESYMERQSISSAGAAGPWQLMAGTARGSGLVVNDTLDERFDVYKSTRVAISLLKFLHRRYNDWHLAVAAYNAGSGRVDQAIKQANSHIYWDVEKYLPTETRAHVKKFMASSFALDGRIPVADQYEPGNSTPTDTLSAKGMVSEPVNASFRLDVIAEKLEIPESQVRQWNTGFEDDLNHGRNITLVLPKDKMPDFLYKKNEILRACIEKNVMESSTTED